MTREYPCRIANKQDRIVVPHELDDDGELEISAVSEATNAHVTVFLTREQVENLHELLGRMLKKESVEGEEGKIKWRDV